ncbi:hypothetical protein [Acinetobacter pittii]|uniref:hypothetical protein n=1 Tax=Acinetobacter pittii TaxID=48296 RepID=UPI00192AC1C9|nr:hypothetical protein [Acinetobacter pittii]
MIFEVTKAGYRLESISEILEEDFRDMESLIEHLISSFFEANHILILFKKCFPREDEVNELSDEVKTSLKERLRTLIERDHPEYDSSTVEHLINLNLPLFEKRYRWKEGELPRSFKRNLPHFYAKSFVFALDNFQKSLKVISLIPNLPNHLEIERILKEFDGHFIHLRGVRNSAHHMEDRIRGLGPYNKRLGKKEKIKPKPIDEHGIKADGGAMLINCLLNNNYSFTNDDGSLGKVEISELSMSVFQKCLQQLLNSFKWSNHFGADRIFLPDD